MVRTADGPQEMDQVYRLRYASYLRKGYARPDDSRRMSDQWDALPGTVHFVAVLEGHVVGAVRLVLDSSVGIPMEREFPQEVRALRVSGQSLAEASALVAKKLPGVPARRLWLGLCRALWRQAMAKGVQTLCAAVTRNHLAFYERLLFEPMGNARPYRSLRGILAYPLGLRVARAAPSEAPGAGEPSVALRNSLRGTGCTGPVPPTDALTSFRSG